MRFELIAGSLCLDFANTIHDAHAADQGEELRGVADLLQWGREAGLLSSPDHDSLAARYRRDPRASAAALARAVAVRDLLVSIFAGVANGGSVSARRLAELDSALAEMPGRLRMSRSSGGISMEWTSAADGLQQVLFAVLTDAAALIAGDRLGRIRECAAADCTWLFVDESRNRSRRWCDMKTCGNRTKARRHYQRAKVAR